MALSEYRRHQVFQWYEEHMEPDTAEAMIEMLPKLDWSEIATKADIGALETSLRGEIAELRGEITGLSAETAADISALDASLRGEIAGVRGEITGLRGEIAGVRGEITGLRGELKLDIAQSTRTMIIGMVASQATLVGLVLAAGQLS